MGANKFAIERKCEIPEGAYGVWQVPEYDIMIPVYQPAKHTYDVVQKVVDDENSATIRKWGAGRIIEDHAGSISMNGKGRWDVSDFKPDTVAFLVVPGKTYCYACKMVCRAFRQNTCEMYDGKPLWPRYNTDIMCASCADREGKETYIATFKQTGTIPG